MMNLKNKKRILKTILGLVFIIVITLPYIDLRSKNKIHYKFNDIEFSIYKSIPNQNEGDYGLFLSYCDTVSQFLNNNPIKLDFEFNFKDCKSQVDKFDIQEYRTDFVKQVHMIAIEYRRSKSRANARFFLIMIAAQIFLIVTKNFIDKKFQEKKNETD
ncbi:hypothetical protein [Saccharicrinis sp. FJH54]|uniref:hypothetical protein n=1 Tax=Saccharicrinis sp. FJH54 TaxID=3344665 RepID=UPI0035D3E9EB